MQRYLVASLVLLLLSIVTTAYAWQTPVAHPPQHARLSYAKPSLAVPAVDETLLAESSPTAVEISLSPSINRVADTAPELSDPLLKPALPEDYDQLEPSVELQSDTTIGDISFSTKISDDFQALEAGRRFGKGFFTLYATFEYDGLADGYGVIITGSLTAAIKYGPMVTRVRAMFTSNPRRVSNLVTIRWKSG